MPRRTKKPRIRRAAKWAGLVVCTATALTWLSSPFWFVRRLHTAYGGSLGGMTIYDTGVSVGIVWLHWAETSSRGMYTQQRTMVGWVSPPMPRTLRWLPEWHQGGTTKTNNLFLALPLWMPLLASAIPTAWLWRRDARTRPGHCPCGYLTGLAPATPCPECGTQPRSGNSQ